MIHFLEWIQVIYTLTKLDLFPIVTLIVIQRGNKGHSRMVDVQFKTKN